VLHFISRSEEKELLKKIQLIIQNEQIDAIIFEDYDKGAITPTLISSVVKLAHENNIIITVDPKKRNFKFYTDLRVLKPNLKELNEGLGIEIEKNDIQSIREAAVELMITNNLEGVIVTLSENGILICERNFQTHIPAIVRNIADVSGAGDTVISILTLALSAGMSTVDAAKLANLAGGIVCEEVGVVPISFDKLLNESKKILK
jgi:rfaE bifunctional protein kinase chain/domain